MSRNGVPIWAILGYFRVKSGSRHRRWRCNWPVKSVLYLAPESGLEYHQVKDDEYNHAAQNAQESPSPGY